MPFAPKLVRDRIPQLIRASGGQCRTRVLDDAEYAAALDTKLREEVEEYLAARDEAELVDVVEVVLAIRHLRGVPPAEFERRRLAKHADRGGFAARLWADGD